MSGRDRLGYTGIMRYNDQPLELDLWQKDYIRNESKFYILTKSRRTGWSFAVSTKGVIKAQDKAVKKYSKIFISYNLDDAMEKIAYCKELYHSIPDKYKKPLVSENKTSMTFLDAGGRSESRLISFPSKAPRGKAGDVSLDEFAFYQGSDRIYTGSLPAIIRGDYDLEIGSTPFGQKGRFYEIYSDAATYPKYERRFLPWWYSSALCSDVLGACEAQNLTTEERVMRFGNEALKMQFLSMPFEDFQQEFECSFRDEQAAYITLEMIRECTPVGANEIPVWRNVEEALLGREWVVMDDDGDETGDARAIGYTPSKHGTLYAGFDVGRRRDASEFIVVAKKPGQPRRLVMKETWVKMPFDEQHNRLARIMQELPIHRLCIDSTGMGGPVTERLQGIFGRRVEGVDFTAEIKETLAQGLYMAFQRHDLFLPPDRELQRQLHAVKKIVTPSGSARYDADREGSSHADQFWALALAEYAASELQEKKSNFYSRLREEKDTKKDVRGPLGIRGPGGVA